MELFRLTKAIYAQPLSGIGAALYGGRWNSKGVELIYTAANRSLAMAEVLVSLPLTYLPDDMVMCTLRVPENIPIATVDPLVLPTDWNSFPATSASRAIGDDFVKNSQYILLQVPSVVTVGDYNYLINPAHPDFRKIKIHSIAPFPFDKRFLRTSELG